jgi:large repetitive protein
MRKITLMLLLSLVPFFALAQFQGFEGTWTTQTGIGPGGPAGWAIANVIAPGQNNTPVTWVQGNGSGAQPAYEGSHPAFINSENVATGTTTEDWLITPLWTVPADGQLRFYSRLFVPGDQQTTYEIRVSTTTTGTDPQTTLANFGGATPFQSFTETQMNPAQLEWTEKVISLSAYAGQQVYIAFVMKGDNGDRWAIDNVRLVSPCAPPTTGSAGNIGSDTADLTWNNPSGATTWEVEVVPVAASPTGEGEVYSGLLPYEADGLTASTQYKFYVRALCGTGDLAVWSAWAGPFNFNTSVCPAANQCNYTFTVWDSFGDGWNGNTMTVSQNGITMGTLTLPTGAGPVNITVPLCTGQPFQLFWNAGGTWAGEVGVSVTNNFSQLLYTKNPGTGAQNSVLYTNPGINCSVPECLPVSGLTATAPTTNSISLNWGGPNTGNWEYYIVPTGGTAPTAATPGVNTTTKPVTATMVTSTNTPLQPDTTYQFYVRVVCEGGTYSSWSGPVSFTTLPTCPKPINLGVTAIGDDEVTLTWTEAATATAWEVYVVPTGSPAPTAATEGVDANSTSFLYDIDLEPATIYQYYVRAICGPGDISTWAGPYTFNTTICAVAQQCTYNFTVWDSFGDGWNGNTMTVSQNGITIATLTLPSGAGPVVVPVAVCDGLPLQLFWNSGGAWAGEVGVSITNNFSQTFYTKNPGTGTQNSVLYTTTAIDCDTPLCLPPGGLTASNPTMDSIQLGWAGPATGNWAYYIVPAGSPAPTAATVPTGTTTTNPVVVDEGLNPGTNYQYYVRVICSETSNSAWAGPFAFNTTLCTAATQCTYNFTVWDSWGDGWNGNTMTVSQNGVPLGTLTLPSGAGPVVIPIAVCNDLPLQLFWNTGGAFAGEVGVSITNNFGQVFYTKNPGTGSQNTVLYTTTAVDCDNPLCLPPSGLTATNPTMDSIQLGWAGPATGNWAYYIVPAGSPAPTASTEPTGTTTTNPVVVDEGLDPATQYQYYVRVICSETSNSSWAGPITFYTAVCNPENKCNYTFVLTDSWGDGWNGNTMTVSQNGVPAATFGSTFTTGQGPVNITVALCNGEPFQLYWNAGGAFANEVGVSVVNGFGQTLYSKPAGSGAQNTLLYTGEIDCDNPACLAPTGVTVTDVTTDSISLTWTPSVVPGATYEVYYTTGGNPAPGETPAENVVAVTTNSAVLTPLDPSTTYDIYVRTICSEESNSIWTLPLVQETDPLCPDPTNVIIYCLDSDSASWTWSPGSTETAWEVAVVPASAPIPTNGTVVTEPVFFEDGLTQGTQYTFYVRAICPNVDGYSGWTELNFTPPPVAVGNAVPLCSGVEGVPQPNNFGGSVPGYGQVGCLFSTPNPQWYYVTAEQAGAINYTLTQITTAGTMIDVDFAAFGPFESIDEACTLIGTPPGTQYIVDCSYSASATEFINVVASEPLQVFALLITNFNGQQGTINLDLDEATSPGGSVCPPTVDLGFNQVLCNTESTTVTASVTYGGESQNFLYEWTLDGEVFTPTVVETTEDTQTIEFDEPGVHVIGVTVSVIDSESGFDDTDEVTIALSPPFTAPTPEPVTLCSATGTADLDFSGIDFLGTLDPDDYEVVGVYPTNSNALSGTGAIDTDQLYNTGSTTLFVVIADSAVPGCYQVVQLAVTVNATPSATIAYADAPFCSEETTGTVTVTGSQGGTFSSTTGLVIDGATGTINVAESTPGTYTITYSIEATDSCPAFSTTTDIVIVPAPEATIAYAGSPYCSDGGSATVTFTGTEGGVYSSTAGLDIDPATGEIDLAASTPGTYMVTYTIPDTADCVGTAVTTEVTITQLPTASIGYDGSPYCNDAGVATVTFTGNTGGTYSADGIAINATTGEITLAGISTGTYTVTYTIAAAAGCDEVTATADITVTELPLAGFAYAYESVCQNAGIQQIALAPGAGTGVFAADIPGLDIDPATGAVNPANSEEGIYLVTNTIAAAGGCDEVVGTFTIEITPAPVPAFSYAAVAYCQDEEVNPIPVLDGVAGTFSAPAGLVINPVTGEVNLAASTPGTYTVTNTVVGTDSCPTVSSTAEITITSLPVLTLGQGCIDNRYSVWVSFEDDAVYTEDNVTIEWTRAGVVIASTPTVNISGPTLGAGTYVVTVTPENGALCPSIGEIVVEAANCETPKGISPNGDELNDTWDLTGFNVTRVSIFNRYGKEVYGFSGAYTNQFAGIASNGEKLPTGTYFYMFQRVDGTTETGWVYLNWQE